MKLKNVYNINVKVTFIYLFNLSITQFVDQIFKNILAKIILQKTPNTLDSLHNPPICNLLRFYIII